MTSQKLTPKEGDVWLFEECPGVCEPVFLNKRTGWLRRKFGIHWWVSCAGGKHPFVVSEDYLLLRLYPARPLPNADP